MVAVVNTRHLRGDFNCRGSDIALTYSRRCAHSAVGSTTPAASHLVECGGLHSQRGEVPTARGSSDSAGKSWLPLAI